MTNGISGQGQPSIPLNGSFGSTNTRGDSRIRVNNMTNGSKAAALVTAAATNFFLRDGGAPNVTRALERRRINSSRPIFQQQQNQAHNKTIIEHQQRERAKRTRRALEYKDEGFHHGSQWCRQRSAQLYSPATHTPLSKHYINVRGTFNKLLDHHQIKVDVRFNRNGWVTQINCLHFPRQDDVKIFIPSKASDIVIVACVKNFEMWKTQFTGHCVKHEVNLAMVAGSPVYEIMPEVTDVIINLGLTSQQKTLRVCGRAILCDGEEATVFQNDVKMDCRYDPPELTLAALNSEYHRGCMDVPSKWQQVIPPAVSENLRLTELAGDPNYIPPTKAPATPEPPEVTNYGQLLLRPTNVDKTSPFPPMTPELYAEISPTLGDTNEIQELLRKAKNGDADAAYVLGIRLDDYSYNQNGRGPNPLQTEGSKVFQLRAMLLAQMRGSFLGGVWLEFMTTLDKIVTSIDDSNFVVHKQVLSRSLCSECNVEEQGLFVSAIKALASAKKGNGMAVYHVLNMGNSPGSVSRELTLLVAHHIHKQHGSDSSQWLLQHCLKKYTRADKRLKIESDSMLTSEELKAIRALSRATLNTDSSQPIKTPNTIPLPNQATTATIEQLTTQINVKNLQATIQKLANLAVIDPATGVAHREAGSQGDANTLQYIEKALLSFGYKATDIGRQAFSFKNFWDQAKGVQQSHNLWVEVPGTITNRYVIIGAHHDSVPYGIGANDNGSGMAGILEMARIFKESGVTPHYTIILGFWGAEEQGFKGSQAFVKNGPFNIAKPYNEARNGYYEASGMSGMNPLSAAEERTIRDSTKASQTVVCYINIDMLGSLNGVNYVSDGDLSDTGDLGYPAAKMNNDNPPPPGTGAVETVLLRNFNALGIPVTPLPLNQRSDQSSFAHVGVPFGNVASGASGLKTDAEAKMNGGVAGKAYDACYHKACDDVNNVDVERMKSGTMAVLGTLVEIALFEGEL